MNNKSSLKIGIDGLAVFCLLGLLIVLYILQFAPGSTTPVISICGASWIGIAEMIVVIYSWRSNYYRLLSPSLIVLVALYLVVCGQSIMWAFGLQAGYRDLIQSPNWGLSEVQIVKGLLYSELCILLLHIAVLLSVDGVTKKTRVHSSEKTSRRNSIKPEASYSAILLVAIVITVVCIGPYLLDFAQTYSYVQMYGYDHAYDFVNYGIDSLMSKVGAFFPVGVIMIIMCWGKKNDLNENNYFWKACGCYILVAIVLGTSLVLGRRTNVILYALTFLIIWFKDRKMKRSTIAIFFALCFVGMASMRLIDLLRSGGITDLTDFFNLFAGSGENPVIDFLGDIGWNLLSTIKVQTLIPLKKGFSYGFTYLVSLTSVIPNLGFWAVHPASEYGMASTWLQNAMGISYGVGFSPVAEAYYNFGVFGPLIFLLIGWFMSKMNSLFEKHDSPFSFLIPVIFTGVIAKSFVRSCFAAVFRPMFLYMVLIPLVVYLLARQIDQKDGN